LLEKSRSWFTIESGAALLFEVSLWRAFLLEVNHFAAALQALKVQTVSVNFREIPSLQIFRERLS